MKILYLSLVVFLFGCAQKPTLDQTLSADLNAQLGIDYLQNGLPDIAKSRLQMALSQAPNNAAVRDAYAYYLETMGQVMQSKQQYQLAMKEAPHSGLAYNNYGTFLCRHGAYKVSIRYFLLAINMPNDKSPKEAKENAVLCAKLANKNVQG